MLKTEKGLFDNALINGETMDFPENCSVYVSDKCRPYFDALDIDLEDIQIALWGQGDEVINSPHKYFVVYKESTEDYVGFFIDVNYSSDGFFASVNYCATGINLEDVEEEISPVLKI